MRTTINSNVARLFAILLMSLGWLFNTTANAQKRVIDEELLSSLVQAKQEEVKKRALINIVGSNRRTLNKVSFNTAYDLVDVLLTEKNKDVMSHAIVGKVADYALSYAAARYLILYKSIYPAGNTKYNAMPLNAADLERILIADYARAQSSGPLAFTGKPLSIDATSDYDIGVENWLFDQTYIIFSQSEVLVKKGLFKKDNERTWDWDTSGTAINYPNFWATRGGYAACTAMKDEIRALLADVESGVVKFDDLASAVKHVASGSINGLDLNNLGSGFAPYSNPEIREVFDLFLASVSLYRTGVGQNAVIARIADFISQYVMFDPEHADKNNLFGFSIDVEGIILAFEDKLLTTTVSPTRNSWFNLRPFFSIGLNYGYFSHFDSTFTTETSLGLSQIAWAGEKVGFKWYLWDWKYTRGQPTDQPFRFHGRLWKRSVRPRDPFLSNWYFSLYGSGLLYTIADLKSESTFNHPIIGTGTGVRFFNGLELNVSYAAPMIGQTTFAETIDAGFWNVGMDIPIFEYIRAGRIRRAK